MKKVISWLPFMVVGIVAIAAVSCNVTRVVTNESKFFTKGDTTCTIITKTTESYDATKKSQVY